MMDCLVKTKEEANLLIAEIDLLLQSFFHVRKGFEETLNCDIRAETANAIRKVKTNDMKKYLTDLKNKLNASEILKLTLAFSPSEKIIESISSWAKNNIKEDILIEISYDPAIVAGITIIFQGKYKDASLKKPLEEFFQHERF